MKTLWAPIVLGIAVTAFAVLFLGSCVVTASDGQGVFVFFFTYPMMGAIGLGLLTAGTRLGHARALALAGKSLLSFLAFFFIASFIPGLNVIPALFVGGSAKAFEMATGASPYQYFRAHNHPLRKVKLELERTQGKEIDLRRLELTFAWNKVCVLGPYTDEAKAAEVVGIPEWKIGDSSSIGSSDSISAMAFVNVEYHQVVQVIELERGLADLSSLTGRCFTPEQTILVPNSHN